MDKGHQVITASVHVLIIRTPAYERLISDCDRDTVGMVKRFLANT